MQPANIMKLRRVETKVFKQAIQDEHDLDGLLPVKGIATTVEKSENDVEQRILSFTISTGDVDRDGDTLNPNGWELGNFIRGGSMLWAHDSKTPIARPLATWLEDDRLKSRVQFPPKELNPFAFMMFEMFRDGYVRGTSVGFIPKEWKEVTDRAGWMPLDFLRQELLEFSGTPVPSNPNALRDAKSKGIDLAPLVDWAEQLLDGEKTDGGLFVSRELAEELRMAAKGDPAKAAVPASENNDPDEAGGGDSGGGGDPVDANPSEPAPSKTANEILVEMIEQVDKACGLIVGKATELAADVKALVNLVGSAEKVLSDESRAVLIEVRDVLSEMLGKDEQTEPADPTDVVELDFTGDAADVPADDDGFELDESALKDGLTEMVSEIVDSSIRRRRGRVD